MASANILNRIAGDAPNLSPSNFGQAQARGESMRASQQQRDFNAQDQQKRNVLYDQGQQERQTAMAQEQEQKALARVREDWATFMQLPDDNARTAAWQGGLAAHYGQDPQTDWHGPIGELTRTPGFLPPEVSAEVIKRHFAPAQQDDYTIGKSRYRGGTNELLATAPADAQGLTNVSPGGVVFDQDTRKPVYTAPRAPAAADQPPSGYRRTATGLEAEPGGPADPANPLNVRKVDTGPRLSSKEMQSARDKMRIIGIAKQQLQTIKTQRDALNDSAASGPGASYYMPLSEKGNNFDKAVDIMRDTITSLTRTPGIGASSDFESRLSQAKLPSRNEYESSRDLAITGLEDLINGLESGYSDMLGQGEPAAPNGSAPTTQTPVVFEADKERRYQEWKAKNAGAP